MFLCGCQFALYAQTISGKCGKNGFTVRWELDQSKGLLLIGGEGEMQDFAPDNERWNGLKDRIFTVAIGKFVTSVGNNAFAECEELKSIKLPVSLKFIGDNAFQYCTCLESVEFPQQLTSVGCSAFKDCRQLRKLEFPHSLSYIGDYCFSNCRSLSRVFIPAGAGTFKLFKAIEPEDENKYDKFYARANSLAKYAIGGDIDVAAVMSGTHFNVLKDIEVEDGHIAYSTLGRPKCFCGL